MPVVLLAELKPLQKEQFFYNVIFKSRNSNYYKTIPNGIVPNFLNFSWYEIVLSLVIIISILFLKCYNRLMD
jgi:hypothetical protein